MANTTNLKWTISKPDWVTVSPSSGEGSQDISVTIQQATSSSDVLTGDIIFTCIDCAPTKTIKIPVERCPYEEQCNCDMLYVSQESKVWNWDNTDAITITVSKSNDCISFKKPVLNSGSEYFDIDDSGFDTQSYSTTFTVKPKSNNDSSSPLEGEISINGGYRGDNCTKTIDLTQYGRQQTCRCEDLHLSSEKLTWRWDETGSTSEKYINISYPPCININVEQTSGERDFTVNYDAERNIIIARALNANTSGEPKKGIIKIAYGFDSTDCTVKEIELEQSKIVCDCKNLKLIINQVVINEVGYINFDWDNTWDSGSEKEFKIQKTDDCITYNDPSFVNGADYFTLEPSFDDGEYKTFKIAPNSTNEGQESITGKIKIEYGFGYEDCATKYIEITQRGRQQTCGCDNFVLDLDSEDNVVEVPINSYVGILFQTDQCITDISAESSDESIAKCEVLDNAINISGFTQDSAIITVSWKANGTSCEKSFTVDVKCPQYNIAPKDNKQLTCSGGTVEFIVK